MIKYAIANQKGGSGKTTTTALLAKSLATHGRVLLVDCDPQGGLTAIFHASGDAGLFDILIGDDPEEGVNYFRRSENPNDEKTGIWIIPADFRLDKIFLTIDPFALERALSGLGFDWMLFDTPPTVQGITRSAIIYSDLVVIPSELSETALGPTSYTVDVVKELQSKSTVVLSGLREFDEGKGGRAPELSRAFIGKFGETIGATIPRNGTTASFAAMDKKWTPKTIEDIAEPLIKAVGVNL